MKKKLVVLALALMAFVGSFLYVVPAEAVQPICWRCVYIWFNGNFCDASGGNATDCVPGGPFGCNLIGEGECNNLSAITD